MENIFGDYEKKSYLYKDLTSVSLRELSEKVITDNTKDHFILRYKDGNVVNNLTHKEQVLLLEILTNNEYEYNTNRYTLIPLLELHNIIKSENEKYLEFYNGTGTNCIYTREIILSSGKVMSNPNVIERRHVLMYEGSVTEKEYLNSGVFNTMRGHGLFSKKKKKLFSNPLIFDFDGYACVSITRPFNNKTLVATGGPNIKNKMSLVGVKRVKRRS